MTEEKIARINALAKSKTTGLTETEKAEQQALRQGVIWPISACPQPAGAHVHSGSRTAPSIRVTRRTDLTGERS